MTAADAGQDDAYPGVPRWVKVVAIIVAALLLLVLVVLAFGIGDHGPGRHEPASGAGIPAADGAPMPLDGGVTASSVLTAAPFGSHRA